MNYVVEMLASVLHARRSRVPARLRSYHGANRGITCEREQAESAATDQAYGADPRMAVSKGSMSAVGACRSIALARQAESTGN